MQTTKQDASWRAPSPFADSFFLTGATASGKTALGVAIARELGAEIVSLDSMAVYRKMDVGTAKPTLEERGGVPHHMIDVVSPKESFSVCDYKKAAVAIVRDVLSRGKTPIVCGGTGLYINAVTRPMSFSSQRSDEALHRQLLELAEQE